MATNEVYRLGQYVPAPVPDAKTTDKLKGENRPLRLGGLNAVQVSRKNVDNTEYGNSLGEASVDFGGAHKFPVTITNGPLKFGQDVFIAPDGDQFKLITADAGDGTTPLFGHALEYNVPNGTANVVVRIAN